MRAVNGGVGVGRGCGTNERERREVARALSSIRDLPDYSERQPTAETSLMIEQLQHGIRGAEKGDSEDLAWLRSRSRSHIHAFEVICDVLDLSADFIRAGLEEHRNGGRALGNGRLPRLPPRLRMAAA